MINLKKLTLVSLVVASAYGIYKYIDTKNRYTHFYFGDDIDAPDAVHVILLDNQILLTGKQRQAILEAYEDVKKIFGEQFEFVYTHYNHNPSGNHFDKNPATLTIEVKEKVRKEKLKWL